MEEVLSIRRNKQQQKSNESKHRTNEEIRSKFIYLVVPDKGASKFMLNDAIADAKAVKQDVVQVGERDGLPVCKIMDYGKFKFEQKKRDKEAKKKNKQTPIKEIKFRPGIDEHDLDHKIRKGIDFLGKSNKVKITLTFSGREMSHPEDGWGVINVIQEHIIPEFGEIDTPPKLDGRIISMVIKPLQVAQ